MQRITSKSPVGSSRLNVMPGGRFKANTDKRSSSRAVSQPTTSLPAGRDGWSWRTNHASPQPASRTRTGRSVRQALRVIRLKNEARASSQGWREVMGDRASTKSINFTPGRLRRGGPWNLPFNSTRTKLNPFGLRGARCPLTPGFILAANGPRAARPCTGVVLLASARESAARPNHEPGCAVPWRRRPREITPRSSRPHAECMSIRRP